MENNVRGYVFPINHNCRIVVQPLEKEGKGPDYFEAEIQERSGDDWDLTEVIEFEHSKGFLSYLIQRLQKEIK